MRISLYILKEHAGPLFLAVFVITFLLLMNRIFRMIDLIISKGLAIATVLKLLALSLPFILAMTIPMAVLVAVVLAFGRLSGDNEIVAFKASGINLFRLTQPVLLTAMLLTIGMIYFNDAILPETNHEFKKLMIAIQRKHPTLIIEPRVFIDDFDGYQLYINEKDDRTSTIRGVIIHELSPNQTIARSIFATAGQIYYDQNSGLFKIDLTNGEIHELDPTDPAKYRKMIFKLHKMNLRIDTAIQEQVETGRGDRELSIANMQNKVEDYRAEKSDVLKKLADAERSLQQMPSDSLPKPDSLQTSAQPQVLTIDPAALLRAQIEQQKSRITSLNRSINKYQVEIHKKFALPFACVVFVLIGAPLGVAGRRGVGIVFSFIAFTFYYIFLIGGEDLADRTLISPFFAMWGANIVLGAIGVFLLFYSNYERISFSREWFLSWLQKLKVKS